MARKEAKVAAKKSSAQGEAYVGISGWRYAGWRGQFYPVALAQRRELEYAAETFRTIEINGTFYSLQRPANYRTWRDTTPANFVFAVKAPRYITHVLRLNGIDKAMANFFASGVLELKDRLGPLLWQFPPNFQFDAARFGAFLDALPYTTADALAVARRRDRARMKGRTALPSLDDRPLRHAFEIRHPSFCVPDFARLLRGRNIALVIADTAGRWPLVEEVTADFLYLRLHGGEELYVSGYADSALDAWAARIALWQRGSQPDDARRIDSIKVAREPRDVFCYFDNDAKVRAPFDAYTLSQKLGCATGAEPARNVDPE
jgi:uncharacterized protein YecE (DUF72 family)